MDTPSSVPATPLRNSLTMSPIDTGSPVHSPSYRQHLRRRTSSFSSNHDRSPVSIRSKHRFSNASQYSDNFSPDGGGAGGGGMGNLADELDELDDEDGEYDEEVTERQLHEDEGDGEEPSLIDGARDSGIDVSYASSTRGSPRPKNFSKPFCAEDENRTAEEGEEEEQEEKLTPELEDAMSSIARMASTTPSTNEDPLFPRVVALLQDLGNQSTLEAGAQRLTTSTNSMTAHLSSQSKALQKMATSLYSPFPFSANTIDLDPDLIDDTIPLIQALLSNLPHPDTAPLIGLQKLDRETHNVIQTLSHLTDTLQMGKQTTNSASRHLRMTQQMVAELRRERERAEVAREELRTGVWEERIERRWCRAQCEDVVRGFEARCEELRGMLGLEVEGKA